jgi:hypothetical protein
LSPKSREEGRKREEEARRGQGKAAGGGGSGEAEGTGSINGSGFEWRGQSSLMVARGQYGNGIKKSSQPSLRISSYAICGERKRKGIVLGLYATGNLGVAIFL